MRLSHTLRLSHTRTWVQGKDLAISPTFPRPASIPHQHTSSIHTKSSHAKATQAATQANKQQQQQISFSSSSSRKKSACGNTRPSWWLMARPQAGGASVQHLWHTAGAGAAWLSQTRDTCPSLCTTSSRWPTSSRKELVAWSRERAQQPRPD